MEVKRTRPNKKIKTGKFMPIFCCCVILPLKNKNPEKYKVCDRVITVNDCAARMMEKWMPRTIGFFRHSKGITLKKRKVKITKNKSIIYVKI